MGKLGDFTQDLGNYMEAMHPGICFYGFGSSVFGNSDREPRDIDGGFIFSEIIADKDRLIDISGQIHRLTDEYGLDKNPCQFNVLDVFSGRDGRFVSYDPTFTHFIRNHGKVFSGPDLRSQITGVENKYSPLEAASFTFRKIRNSFLENSFLAESDPDSAVSHVMNAAGYLRALPRKLFVIDLIGKNGETDECLNFIGDFLKRESKEESASRIHELVSGADSRSVCDIIERSRNFDFGGSLVGFWAEAVGMYEGLIGKYIEQHPPQERQVTTVI